MMNIKTQAALLALLVVVALAGCASLQSLPTPQTPRQTLGYTEAGFTAAVATLTDLRKQGLLTPEQVAQADHLITRGNATLDGIHAAIKATTGYVDIGDSLVLANHLLLQLRAILAAAGATTGATHD